MPRSGNKRKKARSEKEEKEGESEAKRTPRCFVIKRGKVGDRVRDLVKDFREVMMPNCAKGLKESKINRLEDFVGVSGPLGVSHLIIFSATKCGTYMKLIKMPQGPTLTFKVENFSLMRDIRGSQKKPRSAARDLTSAPLQVLNGFAGEESEKKLTAEMVRGLFPPIDVPTFNQSECRRVALFSFNKENDFTMFRHYSVARKTAGIHRGVSKLLRRSRIPKLGHSEDVAEFVLSGGVGASESEGDEPVEVPITGGGKVGVRLTEAGPRMDLQLVKAEDGIGNGAVLWHRYQKRTVTQQEVNEKKARERRKLKARDDKVAEAEALKTGRKRKLKEKGQRARREGEEEKVQDDSGDEGKSAKKRKGGDQKPTKDAKPSEDGEKKKRAGPWGWKKEKKGGGAGGESKADAGGSKGGKGGGKKGGKGAGKSKD